MTASTTPMLTGETGQLEAIQTVRFGVDGSAYEIDLTAQHASELRSMASRYISAARKIQPAPAQPRQRQHQSRPRTQMDREQSRRIRSWARQRGLQTSPRGPIPRHVADEYEATMRAVPMPARSPGAVEPGPVPSTGAAGKPADRGNAARAGQHEPVATGTVVAARADARDGEHGLTDSEKHELRAIADAAKPQRTIVAGRLRTKGLADRDTAGNWWLTDLGRRELISA